MRRKVLISEDGAAFQIGEPISVGAYSSVYKCHRPGTQMIEYAAKIYNRNCMERFAESKQVLSNEITALYAIQSPYICNKVDVFDSDRNVYIVCEYAENGTLLKQIKKQAASGHVSEADARRWLQQLLYGVHDIHSAGFAHRDLKLENVLVDKHGNLRIVDFGFAVPFDPHAGPAGYLSDDCGTPLYVAPEVLEGKRYDGFKADVWSVGVVLYCLLAGSLPFVGRTNEELLRRMLEGRVPECPQRVSDAAMHFIRCCLEVDPQRRWSVEQLMHHPYVRGVEARIRGSDTQSVAGTLTPMSTQTAALFPEYVKEYVEANNMLAPSLSYTSLSLCGRVLNDQQLKQWREMSRRAKRHRAKQRVRQQQRAMLATNAVAEAPPLTAATSTNAPGRRDSTSTLDDESGNISSAVPTLPPQVFDVDENFEDEEDGGGSSGRASALSERLAKNDQFGVSLHPPMAAREAAGSDESGGASLHDSRSGSLTSMTSTQGAGGAFCLRKVTSRDGDLDTMLAQGEAAQPLSAACATSPTPSNRHRRRSFGDKAAAAGSSSLTPPQRNARASSRPGGGGADGSPARKTPPFRAAATADCSLTAATACSGEHWIKSPAPFASDFHLRREMAPHAQQQQHVFGSSGAAAFAVAPSMSKSGSREGLLGLSRSESGVGSNPPSLRNFGASTTSSNGASNGKAVGGTPPLFPTNSARGNNRSPDVSSSPSSGRGASATVMSKTHIPRLSLGSAAMSRQQQRISTPENNNNNGIPPAAAAAASLSARRRADGKSPFDGSQSSQSPTPRRHAVAVASPPGVDLSRVMAAKPSIYLRLEYTHFVVVLRWLFVVFQFIVVGLLRIFFNLKLEKYISLEGPLAQLLQIDEDVNLGAAAGSPTTAGESDDADSPASSPTDPKKKTD